MTRAFRLMAIVILATIVVLPAAAMAQDVFAIDTAATAGDLPANINPTSLRAQLGTVTGIAALALLIVQFVKWGLARYRVGVLSDLPTPAFVVIVGVGLTILANLVLETLPGDLLDLIWQGMFASGMSSAVFSWIKNGLDSPADKSASTPLPMTGKASWLGVLCLPLALTIAGCGQMSPGQQYIVASHSYATTMNVLSDLRAAGMFTTADRKLITQLSDRTDVLLDEMAKDILDGQPLGLPYLLAKVNAVLDDLLTIQLQAQADQKAAKAASKPQPTTQQAQPAGKDVSYGRGFGDYSGVENRNGAVVGFRKCPGGLAAVGYTAAGGSGGLGDGDPQGGEGPLGRWREGQSGDGRIARPSPEVVQGSGLDAWRPGKPIPLIELTTEIEWD